MTAISTAVIAVCGDLADEWRNFRWDHPEWTLAAVAAAAWLGLFALSAGAIDMHQPVNGFHAHHHAAIASPDAPAQRPHDVSIAHLALMMVAMMLPTILPATRAVSLRGTWRRRQRGQALFATGYLLTWITAGLAAGQALTRIQVSFPSRYLVVIALIVAAGWELTGYKIRCLRACCRVRPIPPFGWRADRMCLVGGVRNAIPCLGSCWAIMVSMLVAGHLVAMLLMIPVSFLVVGQRYAVKPRTLVRPAAAGLLAVAVAVAM